MYEALKGIAKSILPKVFLKRYSSVIRNVVSKRYAGNNFKCNVCEMELRRFVHLKRGDLMCPRCGSLPRSRRLYNLLEAQNLKEKRILHFSPPNCLKSKLGNTYSRYYSTNFKNEFEADLTLDITNVDLPNSSYDLVICYHVLEHILEDEKAMDELYRILATNGICLIQTPFKIGDIYEDESIVSDEDRLIHFHQKDHVRIYSAEGLAKRLESAGFRVEVKRFDEDGYLGLKKDEIVLFARKISTI